MPQETNLNVSPYFDDFDPDESYYKVLFKPGYPVQARELTVAQSILQNQIEQLGNHLFKEGSVVVPGNLTYNDYITTVLLEDTFNGVPSDFFLEEIVGSRIRGETSGVVAAVEDFIPKSETVSRNTLVVRYLSSDTASRDRMYFIEGENLVSDEEEGIVEERGFLDNETLEEVDESPFVLGEGEAFATVNDIAVGCSVKLEEGVYYLRGHFVEVDEEVLYLSTVSNFISARVGFKIFEETVSAFEDEDLYDNAQGFSNFSAPGADRLRIDVKLDFVPIDDFEEENFVQLLDIREGKLQNITRKTEYDVVAKEFARRTYDESGDYYVTPPTIKAHESLNDGLGNNGIHRADQLTYDTGIEPNEDYGVITISPMKAYVRVYQVENISPVFLDFPKTRETKTVKNQSINYFSGSSFTLNRVFGTPIIGAGSTYFVTLRDSRVGNSQLTAAGNEIGLARVYDFALESGSYSASNPNENEFDISLFDIQTYTNITLNEPITLSTPTHVRGKESGAVGFLRYDVSAGTALTVYNSKGSFNLGEKLIFDNVENTRVIRSLRQYGLSDVQSLHGVVGTAYTFTGDVIQQDAKEIGQVKITAASGGISTVTSASEIFVGIATVGNLVVFSNLANIGTGKSLPTYAKVETVDTRSITISGITSVSGICEGDLPTSSITPSDFAILESQLHDSPDDALYTELPKDYIAEVDVTEAQLVIRRQFDVNVTANSTGAIDSGADETFLPYDEERYLLVAESGEIQDLKEDMFVFTNGSTTLTVNGVSNVSGNAKLLTTLRKINVKNKVKTRDKVKTLVIDKSSNTSSGVGGTTLNDGLIYGNYPYGTRVQDSEISLLIPEVSEVIGIFESSDTTDPDIPSMTVGSLSGPTAKVDDLLIGESIVGDTSGAIGIFVEKIDDLTLGFCYLNDSVFVPGEEIITSETEIEGVISVLDNGDDDISAEFEFETNEKLTIFDQSKIVRKPNFKAPTRKIKVVFESISIPDSDTGDLVTISSYDAFNYGMLLDEYPKASDIIDVRPRVSPVVPTENSRSPFEFLSRTFSGNANSSPHVLASDESILVTYEYFMPRIDKVVLNETGEFDLILGVPDDTPQPPYFNDTLLDVATIYLPPYILDVDEVDISIEDHKRYTMEDIGRLEDRIENLEETTSLSLLENSAVTFDEKDAKGLNRFKSGFVVDTFKTTDKQDKSTIVKNSVDTDAGELRPAHYTTSIDLLLGTNSIAGIGNSVDAKADSRTNGDLIGEGCKKTGQLITLDYTEVTLVEQPYATRATNVSSYSSDYYNGSVELEPPSDTWVDQVKLGSSDLGAASNFIEDGRQQDFDPQSGFSPMLWNAHSTVWDNGQLNSIKTKLFAFMRERNIEFTAKRLKPLTRVYPFFNGTDMSKYVVPKLLEITMTSGVFQVGEDVIGTFDAGGDNSPEIHFRVAKANHKYGTYNSPNDTFQKNPYDVKNDLPSNYSATSTILNVDTFSLSRKSDSIFGGNVAIGMKLRGQTSKAEAKVSDIKLITDSVGTVIGALYIPDGNGQSNPKFESGSKVFRLTSHSQNSSTFGTYTTSAETRFLAQGRMNVVQDNIISTRLPDTDIPDDGPILPVTGGIEIHGDPPPPFGIQDPEVGEDPEVTEDGPAGRVRCPDPNTLILMADGSEKKAGELVVGDTVKTYHEDTMEYGDYRVSFVKTISNIEKMRFVFEDTEIVCSTSHKFFVNNGWKEGTDMKVGDEVSGQTLLAIGKYADGDVVHITIEDAHTYIAAGLLSHNKKGGRPVEEDGKQPNGTGGDRPRPRKPRFRDTRKLAFFNHKGKRLGRKGKNRLIRYLMAAGMSKKRAKKLVLKKGKITKAVKWFNKQPYSFEIGLKLTKKTFKRGKKSRVEVSGKSTFRGGKGNRKFVGFITASKNTLIRNAGKNRNCRPWRKVKRFKRFNVGKKFIKKIKLNNKATSKRKNTQVIKGLRSFKRLRGLTCKQRKVLRQNRVIRQIKKAKKVPPIRMAKRKVIQKAQRSLRRAKRAAKRTQPGGGRKRAARKVVKKARKVLRQVKRAVRRRKRDRKNRR